MKGVMTFIIGWQEATPQKRNLSERNLFDHSEITEFLRERLTMSDFVRFINTIIFIKDHRRGKVNRLVEFHIMKNCIIFLSNFVKVKNPLVLFSSLYYKNCLNFFSLDFKYLHSFS